MGSREDLCRGRAIVYRAAQTQAWRNPVRPYAILPHHRAATFNLGDIRLNGSLTFGGHGALQI